MSTTRTVTIDYRLIDGTAYAGQVLTFTARPGQTSSGSVVSTAAKTVTTDGSGAASVTLTVGVTIVVRMPGPVVREIVVPSGTGSVTLASLLATSTATNAVQDAIDSAVATHAATNLHIPTGGTTGQVLAKTSNTDRAVEWATASGGGGTSYLRTPVVPVNTGWTVYNQSSATFTFGANGLDIYCPARNSGSYQSTIIAQPFDYTTQSAIIGFLIPPVAGNNSYPARQGIAMFDGSFFMSLLNSDAGIWGTGYNPDYTTLTSGITANMGGGPALNGGPIWWRVTPKVGSLCSVAYSVDGVNFTHWADLYDYGFTKIGFQVATIGSGAENQKGRFRVFDFQIY